MSTPRGRRVRTMGTTASRSWAAAVMGHRAAGAGACAWGGSTHAIRQGEAWFTCRGGVLLAAWARLAQNVREQEKTRLLD